MLEDNKFLKKVVLFGLFCDLLFERERYEIYSLKNIYGGVRFDVEVDKMYYRDTKKMLDFKERLDNLFEQC